MLPSTAAGYLLKWASARERWKLVIYESERDIDERYLHRVCVCVRACVFVRERERERKRKKERKKEEREREKDNYS